MTSCLFLESHEADSKTYGSNSCGGDLENEEDALEFQPLRSKRNKQNKITFEIVA